jgi:diguanylate cyclase (GGDEF)-like protein
MPASQATSSLSTPSQSPVHQWLVTRLLAIESAVRSNNRDRAVKLLEDLRTEVSATQQGDDVLDSMSIRAMESEIRRLRALVDSTKDKLDTVIAIEQGNAATFARFNQAIKMIEEAVDFTQLPHIMKKIVELMQTDRMQLILDKDTYGDFVPQGISLLGQDRLQKIYHWITSQGNRQLFLGTIEDMQNNDVVREVLGVKDTSKAQGSCLVYPFYERGNTDCLAGLICLHDQAPDRYSPHKATDYLEHFCYIFGCTVSMLRAQKFLEKERFTDPLTGVPNRAYLMAYGQQILEFAERKAFPVTLLFIDLNEFKAVNDNYGHHIGDDLLKKVASCLKNLVRKYDMVVRLSGDEFVVLLPGVAQEKTKRLIARMEARIADIPVGNGTSSTSLSASIGVSGFKPGQTIQELMVHADQAMYAIKRQRR